MENIHQHSKYVEDSFVQKITNNNSKRKSLQIKKSIENLSEIIKDKKNIRKMAEESIDGKTDNELRSILWRIYLDIIPYNNIEDINKQVSEARLQYTTKVDKYKAEEYLLYLSSTKTEEDKKFFLSNLNSFFNYNYDKNKKTENFLDSINLIKLDVYRTFQDIDLFRNKKIIDSLLRLLYVWNFENTDVGYCQGMNEIAGTIYYALFPSYLLSNSENQEENIKKTEILTSDALCNEEKPEDRENGDFYNLNSETYVEADVFAIFTQIMNGGFKDLYNYNDPKYKKKKPADDHLITEKADSISVEDINKMEISYLKKRIYRIFYVYLKIIDYILYEFISEHCDPFIFLFRWILCILNREISIKNIIYVWDAIFAIEFLDKNFENYKHNPLLIQTNYHFLDFLCVSMLKNVKYQIINEEDPCKVLSTLMNFPNECNLRQIISDALIIRDEVSSYLNQNQNKRSKFKIDKNYIII